jgi:virginiamycin B lyase
VSAATALSVAIGLIGAVSTAGAPPRVQARISTPGQPIGVAYADGSAWVTSFDRNAVLRIDRATNTIATIPVGPSEGPEGMAFGAGAVWISHKEGAVTRIDPASNSIVARIPVDREARYLAVGAGAVWVTSFDLGTVQRIDSATNRVVKTIRLGSCPGHKALPCAVPPSGS